MLRRSPLLLLLSLASLLLAGCYYSHPRHTDHWTGQREAAVDERREEPFWELIEDPAAAAAMTRLERQAVLVPALRALTPREREVVQLLYLGERTQKETAAALGITQQAVAAAKRRALAKMRQVLKSIHE